MLSRLETRHLTFVTIVQANVDLAFLCETWLRPENDEAVCSLDTTWFLFEVFSSTVWYRWWPCCFTSNQSYKNIAVSTRDFVITAIEIKICEVRLSHDGHTAVFLSIDRPPPSR